MVQSCDLNRYKQLNKPFKIIAFDWDGAAVVNRDADTSLLTGKLVELLKQGVYIIVITGTNFQNINRQFSSFIHGDYKQNLFICTNRGSEVYGFDKESNPVLLYLRKATKEENFLLDKVVERIKQLIEETSDVKVNIVFNRLNRRKLDLIPEWPDPPKSRIGELLLRVQNRLEKGGFAGGLQKAYKLMINIAKTSGFTKAKITSDVKHLEIGLTDKHDAASWMMENIARKNNIPNECILVGGDEFGSIAGFEGSDYKMVLDVPGITYFSVGIEPNGVPEPVIYLGGGPDCFLKVMEKQVELHQKNSS